VTFLHVWASRELARAARLLGRLDDASRLEAMAAASAKAANEAAWDGADGDGDGRVGADGGDDGPDFGHDADAADRGDGHEGEPARGGGWYLRGFTASGAAVGSAALAEGRLFLEHTP
jgi:cellobiose phosphorylase